MEIVKWRAGIMQPPQDDIYKILKDMPPLKDGDVLCIASKVLAIHQGRCVKVPADAEEARVLKEKLVHREAERYPAPLQNSKIPVPLVVKYHTLIPFAGIDESNGNGYFVLWPEKVVDLCREIWEWARAKYDVRKLAVVATDSSLLPMRQGTVGISIGHYGLVPVVDERGKKDIFGRELRLTLLNIVDSLATLANLAMGEAAEQTPVVIVRGFEGIEFTEKFVSHVMPPDEDVFTPLLQHMKKNGKKSKPVKM